MIISKEKYKILLNINNMCDYIYILDVLSMISYLINDKIIGSLPKLNNIKSSQIYFLRCLLQKRLKRIKNSYIFYTLQLIIILINGTLPVNKSPG
jgi:hypothetical protein